MRGGDKGFDLSLRGEHVAPEWRTLAPPSSSPAGTLIAADNRGRDAIDRVAIFSAPGFEDFMRDTSAREGEETSRCRMPRRACCVLA